MSDASKKVPEVDDLNTMADYLHGLSLLADDKSAEALEVFNKCKDNLPPDYNISSLILRAKLGVSFDTKDYNQFLALSKENLALDSTQARNWAAVASAYACVYADKGQDSSKLSAYALLNKAKLIDSTSEDNREYYNMIEYRIYSRKIIKHDDFTKQFPHGWNKNN